MAIAPTFDELLAIGIAEATDARPDMNVEEGFVTEMLLSGAAAMADAVIGYGAQRFKATFVDGAEGDDLTDLADDHWQIQRGEATPARGQATITRSVNGPAGTFAAGTIVKTLRDADGKELLFTLDAQSVWALNEQGSKLVNVTCTETGRGGNVAPGAILRFNAPPFDGSFTVTNVLKLAGGAPAQTDPELRESVRALPNALRRATLDALEYGAKTVSGVRQATATEDAETGIVSLFIADENGGSSAPLIDAVKAILPSWKAAGTIVNVYGGSLVTVSPIRVKVFVRPGVDSATLVAAIQSAIVVEVGRLKIGETLFRGAIERAVRNVQPDGIARVDVLAPALNVEPQANQILRCETSDVIVE